MTRHSFKAALWGRLFFTLGAVGAAAAGAPVPAPALIPVEDFFADSALRSPMLSPDGKYLAYLAPFQGKVSIGLMDLATGKPEAFPATDANIDFLEWKGPDRLVFGGDIGGNESYAILVLDIHTGSVKRLAESYRERYEDRAPVASVLDPLPLDSRHLLIWGTAVSGLHETASRVYGVFRLDVRTGTRVALVSHDYDVDSGTGGYLADTSGVVRIRQVREGGSVWIEHRPDEHSSFKRLLTNKWDAEDEMADFTPLLFAADNRTLYVLVRSHGQPDRVATCDPAEGPALTTVVEFPPGEFAGLVMSQDRTRLLGVSGEGEKPYDRWLDPERDQLQKSIDSAFPATTNVLFSRSDDGLLMVIASYSDRSPAVYELMDRRRHLIMPLGKAMPKLPTANLAPMRPITYHARDGLLIHGYLTLPSSAAPGRPFPLILHPHGGPYGIRDSWGFDREVQLLANRGYAVLQVNYRGSGGYGRDFLEAGRFQWGAKMQDDLTDGVHWAVEQGYADPHRLAIFGASYGGYAALAGAAFTPELYRCAINYVGPGDLVMLTNHADPRRTGAIPFYNSWVGADRKVLADRSPINFVNQIRIPLLNAYGENDPRVDIRQWHELKSALDRAHKRYEFVDEANEGHGFRNESSRVHFYRMVDEFLQKNL